MRLAPFLALRLVRRRGTALLRTSAIAALAAVTLGVAALVVVLGLMTGYQDALRDGILASASHVTALFPAGVSVDEASVARDRLARVPGVWAVAESLFLPGLLAAQGGAGAEVVSVKASTVLPRFVTRSQSEPNAPTGVAIGSGVARRLGVQAGSAVRLQVVLGRGAPRTMTLRVAQVFHSGFAELDERWLLIAMPALRARLGTVAASALEVYLREPDHAADSRAAVEAACPRSALVTTWQENNRNLFAALRWQKLSLGLVLSLVLGVGAFEVASALVVMMTEKRRELGILLAMGGPPALIRRTLLLAGGALGVVGVVAGVALGLVLVGVMTTLGVPHFSPEIAMIYMVERIPLHVRAADLAIVVGLGIAEVLLAALLPSARAAAREPVEVLRWV